RSPDRGGQAGRYLRGPPGGCRLAPPPGRCLAHRPALLLRRSLRDGPLLPTAARRTPRDGGEPLSSPRIITLLTDFGSSDPYVGEMRGVLLSKAPGVVLADLSHGISPGQIRTAAYLFGRTWHRYPAGTVHLIVVDPGVGTERHAIALSARGHWFVAP